MRILFVFCFVALPSFVRPSRERPVEKPKLYLTFDNDNPTDMPGYSLKQWNDLLLEQLQKKHIQVIFFAYGQALDTAAGKLLLQQWSTYGHWIANHTYSHFTYNREEVTFQAFLQDFLKNDSLLSVYVNYHKFFRFPYLKEGNYREAGWIQGLFSQARLSKWICEH